MSLRAGDADWLLERDLFGISLEAARGVFGKPACVLFGQRKKKSYKYMFDAPKKIEIWLKIRNAIKKKMSGMMDMSGVLDRSTLSDVVDLVDKLPPQMKKDLTSLARRPFEAWLKSNGVDSAVLQSPSFQNFVNKAIASRKMSTKDIWGFIRLQLINVANMTEKTADLVVDAARKGLSLDTVNGLISHGISDGTLSEIISKVGSDDSEILAKPENRNCVKLLDMVKNTGSIEPDQLVRLVAPYAKCVITDAIRTGWANINSDSGSDTDTDSHHTSGVDSDDSGVVSGVVSGLDSDEKTKPKSVKQIKQFNRMDRVKPMPNTDTDTDDTGSVHDPSIVPNPGDDSDTDGIQYERDTDSQEEASDYESYELDSDRLNDSMSSIDEADLI